MRTTIIDYLTSKGLEFRETNGQINIKGSKCCGNEKWHHLYINTESGLWDCKVCGERGNFGKYMSLFGDTPSTEVMSQKPAQVTQKERKAYNPTKDELRQLQMNLWSNEEALKYLREERGLKDDTIKYFRLGLSDKGIYIPYYDKTDTVVGAKARRLTGEKSKYEIYSGSTSILFNEQVIDKNPSSLFCVEGEFDAMVLWQLGITNVVSITLGAGSFKEEWAERIKDIQKVYLAFDNDSAGRSGIEKAATVIGKEKCYSIQLDATSKDISDYFLVSKKTKKDFVDLVNSAKNIAQSSSDIRHISEFNEDLRERLLHGEYTGVSTGYDRLDEIIGGYRDGRLIIISGGTSVGKTSFSMNLSLSLADRGSGIMFVSMEMPPIDICRKFLMLKKRLTGSELHELQDPSPELTRVDEGLAEFKGDDQNPALPIFLFGKSGSRELKEVLETCRVAVKFYGVSVIVIDHLHYFAKSGAGNRAAEVSEQVRMIKETAMELSKPIILLAHINRSGSVQHKKKGGMYVPSLTDLKETGTIEQDADQVIFVCRNNESDDEDEKRETLVKVAKNRDGATGSVKYSFSLEDGYFTEKDSDDDDDEDDDEEDYGGALPF